jgi:hypothetical protein
LCECLATGIFTKVYNAQRGTLCGRRKTKRPPPTLIKLTG